MGHIQRRGGRWIARYRAPDGRERSRTFERKIDAENHLASQRVRQATGEWADPTLGRVRFGDVAVRWEAGRINQRATTQARDRLMLRRHVLPVFGEIRVGDVNSAMIQAWVTGLSERYAPDTVRKAFHVLRGVLAVAVRDHMLTRSPADAGIELPAQRQAEMSILTPDEMRDLLTHVDEYWAPLLLAAAHTGMRWGELAGLRLERLDLLRGEIRVEEQLTEISGAFGFTEPKTVAGRRVVAIPRFLGDVLGEHTSRCANDLGIVFASRRGRYLRRSVFSRSVLRPAATAIGRPEVTFHDLRHTHASWLFAAGEPITTVASRLGHRDPSITLRVYAHLLPGQDRAAADRLDGLWRGMDAGYGPGSAVTELPRTLGT